MVRWEPGSRERLEQAAMTLYAERGFDDTTVAEIAERAGLTKRTFFRYYADKREVLFRGAPILQEQFVGAIAAAAGSASAIDAVAAGLEAAGRLLEDRRDDARLRQSIVAASPDLQERELIKLESLAAAIAEALRARGVAEPDAALTAQVGIAVFRSAFARWIADDNQHELSRVIRESLDRLQVVVRSVSAGPRPGPASPQGSSSHRDAVYDAAA